MDGNYDREKKKKPNWWSFWPLDLRDGHPTVFSCPFAISLNVMFDTFRHPFFLYCLSSYRPEGEPESCWPVSPSALKQKNGMLNWLNSIQMILLRATTWPNKMEYFQHTIFFFFSVWASGFELWSAAAPWKSFHFVFVWLLQVHRRLRLFSATREGIAVPQLHQLLNYNTPFARTSDIAAVSNLLCPTDRSHSTQNEGLAVEWWGDLFSYKSSLDPPPLPPQKSFKSPALEKCHINIRVGELE